jgi:DNA polymerase III gamma/tau subunit
LVGPRGSGKTSSARILARLVNCERTALHRWKLRRAASPNHVGFVRRV